MKNRSGWPRRLAGCCQRRQARAWVVGLLCAGLGGCFSGDYMSRMEKKSKQLSQLGDIASVIHGAASGVQDAAGGATGIQLRLPVILDDKAKAMRAADPGAQPPFVQLPGLAYSYEIQVEGQSAYAYFAAVPSAEKTAEAVEQEVQAAIKTTFSSAEWTDAEIPTPGGGAPARMKKLSLTGPQSFGQDVQDGRFDLYLVSSGTHHVLIGWRATVASGSSAGFFDNAAHAMGSVQGNL